MEKLKLGLQIWSVREDFAEKPVETLEKIAQIGYQGVELLYEPRYIPVREPEFYAQALADAGLECYSIMMDWGELQPNVLDSRLEYCKKLPCDTVTLGSLNLKPFADDPNYSSFMLDFVKRTADKIRAAGFKTGFHNHDKDNLTLVDGKTSFFDFLFENITEDFMLNIDTGNAQGGNADPIELVKRYPHRSEIAHFKGYSAENTYVTPIWESEIDVDALIDTLVNVGDTKILSVEFGRRGDYVPMERAEQSYQWLSAKLREKGFY